MFAFHTTDSQLEQDQKIPKDEIESLRVMTDQQLHKH